MTPFTVHMHSHDTMRAYCEWRHCLLKLDMAWRRRWRHMSRPRWRHHRHLVVPTASSSSTQLADVVHAVPMTTSLSARRGNDDDVHVPELCDVISSIGMSVGTAAADSIGYWSPTLYQSNPNTDRPCYNGNSSLNLALCINKYELHK